MLCDTKLNQLKSFLDSVPLVECVTGNSNVYCITHFPSNLSIDCTKEFPHVCKTL